MVSSGAIGAGMGELGLGQRPDRMPQLQAAAAVGQGQLMQVYHDAFRRHGVVTGQVLLTAEDLNDRLRYLNSRTTLFALLEFGVVPIVNENDTTSVAEIAFGDNDFLAAQLTNLLRAELLVILTVTDGLCRLTASGELGDRIDVIEAVTDDVLALCADEGTALGRGGMESKLRAVQVVTQAGEAAVIAPGTEEGVLGRLFDGESIGTLFLPSPKRMKSRKRWIGLGIRPRGKVLVDAGARRALTERGKSLLPSGVVGVEGRFGRGDVVELLDENRRAFARGLANYSAEEVDAVRGLRTNQVVEVLGGKPYDEIIHRDNLVLLTGPGRTTTRR
jgi:glutamate 5-kinase